MLTFNRLIQLGLIKRRLNLVTVISGNDLSPLQHQSIIWTIADLFWNGLFASNVIEK